MGTRYKSFNDTKIESLEQVNLALRDIGQAEKKLALIDAKANEEISKLKEKALKEGEENRKFITETVAKIQAYAEYNRSELFKDTKSLELAFGKIGYRKSTKISVKKQPLNCSNLCLVRIDSHSNQLAMLKRRQLLRGLSPRLRHVLGLRKNQTKTL